MQKSNMKLSASARFWLKVKKTNSCWNWTGAKTSRGYGMFGTQLTHRISYEEFNGKISSGMVIDHLCKNKLCCNPKHLESVTQKENVQRGIGNPLKNKTHCIRGHEFIGYNLLLSPNGHRHCRKCQNIRSVEYRKRKKEMLVN